MTRPKLEAVEVTCSCGKVFTYQRSNRKGNTRTTCSACNVQKARRNIKLRAIEYKGNRCELCGYNRCPAALDFHHLDPSKKLFGIAARGITNGWGKVKLELDKCILVCANCHREIESGFILLSDVKAT